VVRGLWNDHAVGRVIYDPLDGLILTSRVGTYAYLEDIYAPGMCIFCAHFSEQMGTEVFLFSA